MQIIVISLIRLFFFLSIKVVISLRQCEISAGETAQGRAATRVKQEAR